MLIYWTEILYFSDKVGCQMYGHKAVKGKAVSLRVSKL